MENRQDITSFYKIGSDSEHALIMPAEYIQYWVH